jgi:hypothetical protein
MSRFLPARGPATAILIPALAYAASFFMPFDSFYLPTWSFEPPNAPQPGPGAWYPFLGWHVFRLALNPQCWGTQSLFVWYWAATLLIWSSLMAALVSVWKWVAIMNGVATIAGSVWIIQFNQYRSTILDTRSLREGVFVWLASSVSGALIAGVVLYRLPCATSPTDRGR